MKTPKIPNPVIKKLIAHDQRLERIEEKVDRMVTRHEFNGRMDEAVTILRRLDQERTFTIHAVDRLQKQFDDQQAEISHLKKVLNIA